MFILYDSAWKKMSKLWLIFIIRKIILNILYNTIKQIMAATEIYNTFLSLLFVVYSLATHQGLWVG